MVPLNTGQTLTTFSCWMRTILRSKRLWIVLTKSFKTLSDSLSRSLLLTLLRFRRMLWSASTSSTSTSGAIDVVTGFDHGRAGG
jgi:hypothetical protein